MPRAINLAKDKKNIYYHYFKYIILNTNFIKVNDQFPEFEKQKDYAKNFF